MNISGDIWVWLAGLGSVAIFSFIFKENPVYRFCEHLYVGAAAGYAIGVNFKSIYDYAWTPLIRGKVVILVPIALGLMLYTRFVRNIAWLSRWPMAFLMGVGSALSIYGILSAEFIAQVRATLLPLNTFNNIFMVVGLFCILLYFFFSMEQKGAVKYGSTFGRWVMMITFGASFGNVVMSRISLLIGAFEGILGDWLGIISM